MKPFILIEVEDNSVSDTTIIGDTQVIPIVIDWDTLADDNGDDARDLMNEILGNYSDSEVVEGQARDVMARLRDIVDENEDDILEDDEDEDDEDDFIEDDDSDADMEDDDEDFDDEEDDDEDDEKSEADYVGNEFNVPAPPPVSGGSGESDFSDMLADYRTEILDPRD